MDSWYEYKVSSTISSDNKTKREQGRTWRLREEGVSEGKPRKMDIVRLRHRGTRMVPALFTSWGSYLPNVSLSADYL